MHELSHLHLRQHLGYFKTKRIPGWFHEGFADYVANSGGEGIEDIDAVSLLLSGNHFTPIEKGAILGSFHTVVYGLSAQMFHKQAKMFVSFINGNGY